MNIGDSICLRSAFYSFRYRITELYGNSLFNFLRDCQTGFPQQLAVASYTPTSNVQGFHFLQVLAKTCCFPFFFLFLVIQRGVKCYCIKLHAQCSSLHHFVILEYNLYKSKYFAHSLPYPQLDQAHSLCSINMY